MTETETPPVPTPAPPPEPDPALAEAHRSIEEGLARECELEARLREVTFAAEASRAARALGLVDEEAAVRLLDRSGVELDAAGKPTNLEALLADMARKRPWLAGQPPAPASTAANPALPRPGLTRDDVRRMTAEQINANWDAVQAALRG